MDNVSDKQSSVCQEREATSELMTKKMTVLLENNEKGSWIIPELRRWFSPRDLEMSLVQVMEPVSHRDEDPSEFWEKISHQRNKLHTIRKEYIEALERDGFNMKNDYVSDASDEGCRHILQESQDLFIVATGDDQQRHESASSFTLYISKHALSSVLVLKRLLDANKDKITVVLATDGSEASLNAARKLPQFLPAEKLDVILVNIKEIPIQQNPVLAPYVNMETVDTALDQNSKMALEMTREVLEENRVRVKETLIFEGTPTYELIHRLDTLDADLVTVGSHNRKGLSNWLLGSVSHRLVQSDNHNVLVIR